MGAYFPGTESGGECYCGKVGCVERILAGKSLERYYLEVSGQRKLLRDIIADKESDPFAQDTYNRLIHFFGLGLSQVINILDPDVIILGGGVGNVEALYTEGVREVAKHTFNTSFSTKIVKPKLGDSAGVFGAALLNKN